ncbi:MAG: ATP-binding cassette domain-containing protein [Pseudobacteriovorax sp.]|nr:ATP-binding cassette domain-containing protein [Pseudobacteriovorax sp.]
MADNLFEIQDLCLCIGNKPIFSGINLNIPKNQTTAIIGPSGCGKSSFLSCLNLLITHISKYRLVGKICWNNNKINDNNDLDMHSFRRKVGTVFQQPMPFPTTIRKNLSIPLRQHFRLKRSEENDRIESVLKEVGLWEEIRHRIDHSANDLSGGQKQRLCLARALILNPDVMLMDEPCSALDPISTQTVEALIQKLKSKLTTVIVTHNLQQAKRLADHIVVFWFDVQSGGYIIESGSSEKLFSSPEEDITRSYLRGALG